MSEAIHTLQRQAALLSDNMRISERQLHKAEPDSEAYRAAQQRRDILKSKLSELSAALVALGATGVIDDE
jgi:hypothetical protein